MSLLTIRKKSLKTWLHTDSVLGNFIISKFYFNADGLNFQIVEQGQSKRVIYSINDITLYDDTNSGTAETFSTILALSLRLEELSYPAFFIDGQITSISNLIEAGDNVTITGDGTAESPYVINSTGGGGSATLQDVTDEGNTTTNDIGVNRIGINDQAYGDFGYIALSDDVWSLRDGSGIIRVQFNNGLISTRNKISGKWSNINNTLLTVDRNYELPNQSGTIALLSDIPAASNPTFQDVTSNGDTTTIDVFVQKTNEYVKIGDANSGNVGVSITNNDFSEYTDFKNGSISYWDNTNSYSYLLPDNPSLLSPGEKRLATLDDIPLLDGVVPYTGATSDVDLGDKYIIPRQVRISNADGRLGALQTDNLTDNRGYQLPDASGTIALLSDIPTGGGGIPHTTASGTDTYTATVTGVTSYADGDAYLVRFTNGNTTSCTLNINSLGAIPLYRNNDGALIGGDIIDGAEMLCIYNSSLNEFQVIGTAPNSLFSYVTNADSVTLTKGMPVYAFGGTGDRMTVKRASNLADATSAQTVGLVLSTSIAAGQKGLIMMQGLLDGLSILPTSTFSDGDAIYLGSTAGTITNVKPYAPNHLVYLGVVTTANNGSAGRMYVRVQNGYELDELHNVQAQSPSLNDTLWYDNTVSPGQWKTASIHTILGYTPPNIGLVQAMTIGLQNIF